MTEAVVIKENELAEFVRGYLVAALWSTTDGEDGNLDDNYDIEDLHPATLAVATEDCKAFMTSNWEDLQQYAKHRKYDASEGTVWDYAGHDFWLTRCGHGAGFWDRGLGRLGERLSEAARIWKNVDLYAGDDHKLYIMGSEPPKDTPTEA